MNEKDKKSIDALEKEIKLFMDSKMSVTEFIRRRIMMEYGETGDAKIKSIAMEYFLERLDAEDKKSN